MIEAALVLQDRISSLWSIGESGVPWMTTYEKLSII